MDKRGVLLEAITGATTLLRTSPLPPVGAELHFDLRYGEIMRVTGHHGGRAVVTRGCDLTDAWPYAQETSFRIIAT